MPEHRDVQIKILIEADRAHPPRPNTPSWPQPSGLTRAGRASYTKQRRLHYMAEKNACERVCERVRSPIRFHYNFNLCANA